MSVCLQTTRLQFSAQSRVLNWFLYTLHACNEKSSKDLQEKLHYVIADWAHLHESIIFPHNLSTCCPTNIL